MRNARTYRSKPWRRNWSPGHRQLDTNSLALAPDDSLLFVANANINAIAVFDISEPGRSRSLGFIPAGWYPTSVRVTPDGRRLLVANGKGLISRPNRNGPQPGRSPPRSGSASRGCSGNPVDHRPAGAGKFKEQLRRYHGAGVCLEPPAPMPETTPERGHPVPVRIGEPSPDPVLHLPDQNEGAERGRGSPSAISGRATATRRSVSTRGGHSEPSPIWPSGLFDNFYVERGERRRP